MERALKTVTAPWTMHWIEGADHSLKGEKAMAEITAGIADWLPTVQRAP
jgi:predicted alpha/beta-hydrolase family hydrolase